MQDARQTHWLAIAHYGPSGQVNEKIIFSPQKKSQMHIFNMLVITVQSFKLIA